MPGHRIRTKLASPNGMQSLIGLSSRRRQNRREGYLSRDLMKQISADSPKNTSNGCLRQGLDDSAKMRLCLSYSDAAPPFSFKTKRKSYTSKLYVLSQSRNPEDTDCESSPTLKTGSGYENMVSESRTGSGKSVTLCYRSSSLDSIPEGESPMTDERLKLTGGPCVSPPAPKRLSRFSGGGCEQLTAVPGLLITPVFEDRDTSREASGLFRRPINKFRRMARAVLMLIQVCNICKELLYGFVKKEPWFALIDNLVAASNIKQKRKGPRAFVTFVPNERRELVQLTFDVAEFKRDHRTEFLLTDEVREVMRVMPGNRRPDQVVEILRCLKALSKDFANYSLATQKLICQHAFYDKYRFNRVILKKGQQADGIYFVLSGSLIEKHDTRKHPKEITVGEKFGENDLLCGNKRRHTVLTRTDTELFYLHRQDYRVIFNMSDDALNPKNLDICKQHIVFQHFPMQRLVENPGVWSVIKYKYGQLIALDLNTIDWIYVIKSGEARVLKYLQPGRIDVRARRRKVQAMINSQSPFYRKKRILNFMEEREYIKSAYRPTAYHPPVGERASARSAPPASSRRQKTPVLLDHRTSVSLPSTRQGQRPPTSSRKTSFSASHRKDSKSSDKPEISLPKLVLDSPDPISDPTSTPGKREDVDNSTVTIGEPKVVVETVEELSGDLASHRSRRNSCEGVKEGEGGHLTARDDGENEGGRSRRGSIVSFDGNRSRRGSVLIVDGTRLNVDSPAEGKTLTERRMSVDMSGGLFDKPRIPGQRRQSILIPADGKPEGFARRPSIVIPPADVKPADPDRPERTRGRSASFLKTPSPGTGRSTSPGSRRESRPQVIQVGNHTLPAFVQVETLHPGQVFGLRACLDEEERGPSVSLVSGECEVLQINKKFFMRHCDDAIYSLIRLKNKPFPSEEDLIDRLDVNMQWEEFKQQTLSSFLKECRCAKR